MTSGTTVSAFEHDPLPDSTTHFRLLHILRGDFGQHAECEISLWPIDDAPSYYAISYTWGDPADTTEITVNGKPLAVRRNCAYVLQQVFATEASRYYWVDAICIAQTSTQERNHQVGIMGKIYSRAKHVFACVGPHADDSEWLMATLEQQRPILEEIAKWGQSIREYHLDVNRDWANPIYRRVWRRLRCRFTMNRSGRLRMTKAFISFMQRPYFTRVWILQELHLATGISYCCGIAVQPGEQVRALDSLLEYWNSDFGGYSVIFPKGCRSRILWKFITANRPSKYAAKFRALEEPRSCLRLGVSSHKERLWDILLLVDKFHCVDSRDNLYGVLSIVKWQEGQQLSPDYKKDCFEVAKQAASVVYQDNTYMSFVTHCSFLFKLFNVTLELQSLRDAIALRSSTAPQAGLELNDADPSGMTKVPTEWNAVQIGQIFEHADDQKQRNLILCYQELEQNIYFTKLRWGAKCSVYAPRNTKVGDWCLVERRDHSRYKTYALILRNTVEHGYVVIGPAYVVIGPAYSGIPLGFGNLDQNFWGDYDESFISYFTGLLDPEDLVILAWTLDQFRAKDNFLDRDIRNFVNMRVCGWKASSYFYLGFHASRAARIQGLSPT